MSIELTPQQFAALVDNYHLKKQERLKADRTASALKKSERNLKETIIHHLREQDVKVIGGTYLTVTLQKIGRPSVADWPTLYEYISENEAYDLLHRRLTTSAVEERWENGENIPGVVEVDVYELSESTVRPTRKGAKV